MYQKPWLLSPMTYDRLGKAVVWTEIYREVLAQQCIYDAQNAQRLDTILNGYS